MSELGRSISGRMFSHSPLIIVLGVSQQHLFLLTPHACRAFFIISPYMGPLLAAFMLDTQPWPVPFWVTTALTASCLVLVILFLEETYYDRSIPAAEQPPGAVALLA